MKPIYRGLVIETGSGELREDVYRFLASNGCPRTAEHSMRVGAEAARVAGRYGIDARAAECAGYLHDISAVFPNERRIRAARELGLEVLPEEETFPLIIHQKISKAMAADLFCVADESILDAVGCHTTLRSRPTPLDLALFVADKIEWDQPGVPPYRDSLLRQADRSLEHAALEYIRYLWSRRETLKVVHPWLAAAYMELSARLGDGNDG